MSTTELDLDAIESRQQQRQQWHSAADLGAQSMFTDIEHLLAEVRRLQSEIERLKGNQDG